MVTAHEFCIFTEVTTHRTTGLKANWKQFTLLVLVNAFVGGMVGMERTLLPEIAVQTFHLAAQSAILSFILVFGLTKAFSNYFAGALAQRVGRKNLLVIGWLFVIPVPFLLMFAPSWEWIIAANVLLGINQGLAWSSTVVMKIDLAGEKQRGLAMGLNEFAGYLAVGAVAFFSGYIAQQYGLRPYPFYLGIGMACIGLLLSVLFVKDTQTQVALAAKESVIKRLHNPFWETTWKHRVLGTVTQAGLINNLNDGMLWGILPVILSSKGFTLTQIASIIAIYPIVWGISQLGTGILADKLPKKQLLFWGMFGQGIAIIGLIFATDFLEFIGISIILGLGTAMVYPTFLASIADHTHPLDRAKSIGVFRLWRDGGYALGAILTGILADWFNIQTAIAFIGGLTLISALVIWMRMPRHLSS
jgi:MFS family permease